MKKNDPTYCFYKQPALWAHRRKFLGMVSLSTLALFADPFSTANAGYWKNKERKLKLNNLWTQEKISIVYWREGQYIDKALQSTNYLLRDWRTGEVGIIFYQLLDHLVKISEYAGIEANFDVVSGFRSNKTNSWLANKSEGVAVNSLHTLGMAIDIQHPKILSKDLFITAQKLKLGGTGYYKHSDFVHIDVGPVRSWINQ